jgi:hypothetical protein
MLVFSSSEGGLQPTEGYAGRISLVSPDLSYGKGSINLTSIRESDGGWYECSVFFPNRTPSTRPNGTWFHLSVEGEIHTDIYEVVLKLLLLLLDTAIDKNSMGWFMLLTLYRSSHYYYVQI